MKLQIALDMQSLDRCIELLDEVREYVDILEPGKLLRYYGIKNLLPLLRARYPEKTITADLKLVKAMAGESQIAFEYGADRVVCCSLGPDKEIKEAIEAANKSGHQIVTGLLQENWKERIPELYQLKPHVISVGTLPEMMRFTKEYCKECQISFEGGVTVDNIEEIASYKPDIIIVGKGIWKQSDPKKAAKAIKEVINRY